MTLDHAFFDSHWVHSHMQWCQKPSTAKDPAFSPNTSYEESHRVRGRIDGLTQNGKIYEVREVFLMLRDKDLYLSDDKGDGIDGEIMPFIFQMTRVMRLWDKMLPNLL